MQESKCIICNKTITNPICLNCLNKEVNIWLEEKGHIIDLTGKNTESSPNNCILCNNNMDICPHCHAKDISTTLKEEYPKLVEEFSEVFRY
tara:strand:+ start:7004 stop:7276 length:273 start_codon:yes stop_codon:yes gene_type:complete